MLVNRVMVRLWPFKLAALSNFVLARLHEQRRLPRSEPSVSITFRPATRPATFRSYLQRGPNWAPEPSCCSSKVTPRTAPMA